MTKQSILLFMISFPNIILGITILVSARKTLANKFFAFFAFAVGLWSFGLACFLMANDLDYAYALAQVYYLSAAMIPPLFLAFSFFSGSRSSVSDISRKTKFIYLVPALAILLILIFMPNLILERVVNRDWGKEVILNRFGYSAFALYFTVYVIRAFKLMVDRVRSSAEDRATNWYFLVGLVVAFAMGMVFNLILPFLGNYRFIWIGPLFTLVYIAMVAYSIVRHGLFDIKLVLARLVAYLLALGSLIIIYGLFLGILIAVIFGEAISISLQQAGFILIAITFGLSLLPVKRFFDRVTSKIFFQDSYNGQDLLRRLNDILITSVDVEKLLGESAELIRATVKADFCFFGLKGNSMAERRIIGSGSQYFSEEDIAKVQSITPKVGVKVIVTSLLPDKYTELRMILQDNSVAVIVRLTDTSDLKKTGIGYLVMGDKRSGSAYSRYDIEILKIIADEYTIAIQNALRFEEIEQFGKTMERKVAQATHELQKTNDRLKALDETKDEFISMASHQLRTPLTSVKGYLSMVLEGDAGKLNKTQRSMLDQAYFSSQRMVYLISDLLNVSRLRTGKFVIDYAPTNLSDIVSQEVSQLDVVLKNHDLKLVYDPPEDMPLINLDETKIRQVIMNFIDNAIYYTPSGGTITLSLTNTDKEVHFTVTDTGIGVPKSEQHQLFTKFFRAHNARRARPDGTGLGLFMAKKVIIAQNGSLIFRSKEGKGSTFGFIFPVV